LSSSSSAWTTRRASERPRPGRLLVLEDEAVVALDLCMRLSEMGFEVIGHAASARQAFGLAEQTPPDVVLVDIVISGDCDGIEAARIFQERFQAGVVYLTAYGNESIVSRALTTEPYGYLLKPIREPELRTAVEAALGKCRTMRRLGQRVSEQTEQLADASALLGEKILALQEALHANDFFLARVSHELRTPLTAILGYSETLLMGLHGSLNEEQSRHLSTINRNSDHLLSLINDLLDLSKINSGQLELTPEVICCQAMIEEICATFAPLAARKSLALRGELAEHGLTLVADKRSLHQILLNLVSNALKFTRQGEVSLTCRRADSATGELVFEIRDTGPGLTASERDKLFRPFSQIRSAEDARAHGTGLGLHLSLLLARQMNGTIEVESESGLGSTFTLVLPAQAVRPA
jgi:signal transduction histidine kinase